MSGPEIVFGAGSIRTEGAFSTSEAVQALFKALETAGIKTLDTAQLYGDSETVLGREKAGTRFIIVCLFQKLLFHALIAVILTLGRIQKSLEDSELELPRKMF